MPTLLKKPARRLVYLLLSMVVPVIAPSSASAQSMCRTGSYARYAKNEMVHFATDTSSDGLGEVAAEWRAQWGVAAVPVTAVVIVSQDSLCSVAAVAHFRTRTGDSTATMLPIAVIKVSSLLFAVLDPANLRPDGVPHLWVYDKNWTLLTEF